MAAMYERHHEPLLPRAVFLVRVARSAGAAAGLIFGSLAAGVLGYHWVARLAWVDALLNASMILTGMGPVNAMTTTGAKIFASAYALFSGVAFLTSVGVFVAPIVHRFLHRFHLEVEEESRRDRGKR